MSFKLDARLNRDCIVLGRLNLCRLLLMNNSAIPWFILVPEVAATEFVDLAPAQQQTLWLETGRVADFVRTGFDVDKLNVGAIGNVVSQLHVHVVGRRHDDYCWPEVVWGRPAPAEYTKEELAELAGFAESGLSLEPAQ